MRSDLLLPDPGRVEYKKWSVIACDQFTSEPEYWEETERIVGDSPSALRLILPEVYLSSKARRIPEINQSMRDYLEQRLLRTYKNARVLVERTQSDGKIRTGIVGQVDLEAYDYTRLSKAQIRATEGTVLERIPPRVAIRKGALLELPHVMLLYDDRENLVSGSIGRDYAKRAPLYDFDLMQGGGHIRGTLLTEEENGALDRALAGLSKPSGFLFAVGDGNHSLAAAKENYERIKKQIGPEKAKTHPARFALCEIVNLHDPALSFEPIYRVVFGADKEDLVYSFCTYIQTLKGKAKKQPVTLCTREAEVTVDVLHPTSQLAVGTVQAFLDGYLESHPGVSVDYVHDEDSVRRLVEERDGVAFLFAGMKKEELFPSVDLDGALPRKTFSMGHARDKRYYLEARFIK